MTLWGAKIWKWGEIFDLERLLRKKYGCDTRVIPYVKIIILS